MKRAPFIAILLILVVVLSSTPAFAATATPNQSLSFRTGPNTRYTELFTLPQSTKITPLAYEEGNGVTWVLCEFTYKGEVWQGYTGLNRMEVHGDVPWTTNLYGSGYIPQDAAVYAAPESNAAQRGVLREGAYVIYLQAFYACDDPDCEDCMRYAEYDYLHGPVGYAFVEYLDQDTQQPARGWISLDAMAETGLGAGYLLKDSPLYSEEDYSCIGCIPRNTIVAELPSFEGNPYSLIEYRDENGVYQRAYIPSENLKIY